MRPRVAIRFTRSATALPSSWAASHMREGEHDYATTQVPAVCGGRDRGTRDLHVRLGTKLSGAAGTHHRRLSRRRPDRHNGTPDCPTALGAARPTIHR